MFLSGGNYIFFNKYNVNMFFQWIYQNCNAQYITILIKTL